MDGLTFLAHISSIDQVVLAIGPLESRHMRRLQSPRKIVEATSVGYSTLRSRNVIAESGSGFSDRGSSCHDCAGKRGSSGSMFLQYRYTVRFFKGAVLSIFIIIISVLLYNIFTRKCS